MKQKNLWIAALALGITLSAHGQQSGGGISRLGYGMGLVLNPPLSG